MYKRRMVLAVRKGIHISIAFVYFSERSELSNGELGAIEQGWGMRVFGLVVHE
jgi:hypothetical protein